MSIKIGYLLNRNEKPFVANGIAMKWVFFTGDDHINPIEKSGLYNIKSEFNSNKQIIDNGKTSIVSFYNIFNTLVFSDANEGIFSLPLNRVTKMEMDNLNGIIEFLIHKSSTCFPFNLQDSVTSGRATFFGSVELINQLIDHVQSNIKIQNRIPIPRCKICYGVKTVKGELTAESDISRESFVCIDCLKSLNKYYNSMVKEIESIKSPEILKIQEIEFVNFIEAGKKKASILEDIQVEQLFNLLLARIQYILKDLSNTQAKIYLKKIANYGLHSDLKILSEESQKLEDFINEQEQLRSNSHISELLPIDPPLIMVEPEFDISSVDTPTSIASTNSAESETTRQVGNETEEFQVENKLLSESETTRQVGNETEEFQVENKLLSESEPQSATIEDLEEYSSPKAPPIPLATPSSALIKPIINVAEVKKSEISSVTSKLEDVNDSLKKLTKLNLDLNSLNFPDDESSKTDTNEIKVPQIKTDEEITAERQYGTKDDEILENIAGQYNKTKSVSPTRFKSIIVEQQNKIPPISNENIPNIKPQKKGSKLFDTITQWKTNDPATEDNSPEENEK
jgi:hypothetical protein